MMFGRKQGHTNELTIPAAAENDPQAFEMLRIWIGQGREHASIRGGQFDDAGSWGVILADLAKHMADAFARETGQPVNDVLQRIKSTFAGDLN